MSIYVPYFYIIQDTRNGKYYAGSKYGRDANPELLLKVGGYMTTSKTVKNIIQENGIDTFIIRKIRKFDTREKANNYETRFLVKVDARNNKMFYNGHNNDWSLHDNKNKVSVKDSKGKTFQIDISDERYKSGELVGITAGMKVGLLVGSNKIKHYATNDKRWETGELYSPNARKSHYKDKNGESYFITKEQAKVLNLTSFSKGFITVKDKEGNSVRISKDDPRYLSGELVGITKGKIPTKDKEGRTIIVDINDERLKTGELSQVNKDMLVVKDKEGNVLRISKDDPRILSGELVGVSKNKKRYNNGIVNVFLDPGQPVPDGFVLGGIQKKKYIC